MRCLSLIPTLAIVLGCCGCPAAPPADPAPGSIIPAGVYSITIECTVYLPDGTTMTVQQPAVEEFNEQGALVNTDTGEEVRVGTVRVRGTDTETVTRIVRTETGAIYFYDIEREVGDSRSEGWFTRDFQLTDGVLTLTAQGQWQVQSTAELVSQTCETLPSN